MHTPTPVLQGKDFPGSIKHYYREGNRFFFDADKTILEVTILTNEIIRFRFNREYFARDFSYAIDPAFKAGDYNAELTELEVNYQLETSSVRVLINKTNLRIRIEDLAGKVICEDENGY